MIRQMTKDDLTAVMEIWLQTNIQAHDFISQEYWTSNEKMVREMIQEAEVYVYEDELTKQILGFIGLTENDIEGIFVREEMQSKGIGKQLLHYVQNMKTVLDLSAYKKNVRAIHFYQREGFSVEIDGVDARTGQEEYVMLWRKVR